MGKKTIYGWALDKNGNIPLALAVKSTGDKRSRIKIIKLLLDYKSNPNFSKKGSYLLGIAVENLDEDVVKLLLEYGAKMDIISKGPTGNLAPFAVAIRKQNFSIVKSFINHGVNVNAVSYFMPLGIAVLGGDLNIVQLLLDHGACFDSDELIGDMSHIASYGKLEILKLLVKYDMPVFEYIEEMIKIGEEKHHINLVNYLVSKGAVSVRALYDAVENREIDVVADLLRSGVDVNVSVEIESATHIWGNIVETPLHVAANNGDLEIVELLIKAGANVNVLDGENNTPLYWASYHGHVDVVRLLCNQKADTSIAQKFGWTPLIGASGEGHSDVVNILIEVNANLNACNDNGNTSLMVASRKGYLDVVEILIIANADTNIKNRDGKTAIDCALSFGKSKVVDYLESQGTHLTVEAVGKGRKNWGIFISLCYIYS